MELEYKSAVAEFKAGETDGDYEGYFAITSNVDDGGDVIEPGAFKRTLGERGGKVRVFWGHDPLRPIGPPPSLIVEDSKGLFVKGRLTVGSFWGREAWILLKDGALTEGSIGYRSVAAKTEWKGGHRHLGEVDLFEVSFVALGMNPETGLRALKAGWSTGGGEWGFYAELMQRFATGLEQAANGEELPDLATCQALQSALGLVNVALGNVIGKLTPQTMYLGHDAFERKLRAAELGLTLAH